jgi:hypothetical protein
MFRQIFLHFLVFVLQMMINEGYNANTKEVDLVRLADVATTVNLLQEIL